VVYLVIWSEPKQSPEAVWPHTAVPSVTPSLPLDRSLFYEQYAGLKRRVKELETVGQEMADALKLVKDHTTKQDTLLNQQSPLGVVCHALKAWEAAVGEGNVDGTD
jgi:hypothetical protein